MNQPMRPAMMEDPDNPPPQGPLSVWSRVYTKPGEQTFMDITSHPDARAKNAYIWVFIAGTLSGLISSLSQFVLAFAQLRQVAPEAGGSSAAIGAAGLIGSLFLAPLNGLYTVLTFAGGVAIIHGAARFLGGQGSFDRLAYAFAAVTVPLTVILAFVVPLNTIPIAAFCTAPISIVLLFYVIYLEVAAIKAVHQLGWGEAVGALFLPTVLIVLACGVLVLLGLRLLGLSINDVMQQIQSGLP